MTVWLCINCFEGRLLGSVGEGGVGSVIRGRRNAFSLGRLTVWSVLGLHFKGGSA